MKNLLAAIAVMIVIALLGGCVSIKVLDELVADNLSEQSSSAPESDSAASESESSKSEAPPAQTKAANGIDYPVNMKYLQYVGKTYEEIAKMTGDEPKIYINMDWGVYASFSSADIACFFDSSIFENNYEYLSDWLADDSEFADDPDYADRYYIGDNYKMSEFVAGRVYVAGDEAIMDIFGKREKLTDRKSTRLNSSH